MSLASGAIVASVSVPVRRMVSRICRRTCRSPGRAPGGLRSARARPAAGGLRGSRSPAPPAPGSSGRRPRGPSRSASRSPGSAPGARRRPPAPSRTAPRQVAEDGRVERLAGRSSVGLMSFLYATELLLERGADLDGSVQEYTLVRVGETRLSHTSSAVHPSTSRSVMMVCWLGGSAAMAASN